MPGLHRSSAKLQLMPGLQHTSTMLHHLPAMLCSNDKLRRLQHRLWRRDTSDTGSTSCDNATGSGRSSSSG